MTCGLSALDEEQAPGGGMGFPAWPPGQPLHPVPPAEAPCGLPPTEESSEVRAQSPCPVPGLLAGCCLTLIQPVGRVHPCPSPLPACMAAASSSCSAAAGQLMCRLLRGPSWSWVDVVALPPSSLCCGGLWLPASQWMQKPRLTPADATSSHLPRCFSH